MVNKMIKMDINRTFNRIVKVLYRVGIWREWEGSVSRKWAIKGSYMLAYILLVIFMATCAVISENRNEFVFLWLAVGIVSVIGIKLAYMLWKKDEILTFLTKTTELRKDMSKDHRKRVDFFLKFVNGYIGMLIVAAIFYNTSCLPWVNSTREKKLPFFIRFTWEGRHSEIIYWMCYVFVGTGVLYCNISNLITSIIWYLMQSFAIEYEILGNKLKELGTRTHPKNVKGPVSPTSSREKKFLRELVRLVKAHQNLFKNITVFRSCFFKLFLIQMTTSGTSICVSTYNLAFNSSNNFFQTAIYVVVMMYAFFDIFLVMYLGNEIKLASSRLSYCLFESEWKDQSTADKKCVIIIGEVLKKPQELVIFIYPINLQTFTMIIKGAYTLFNVLQNFD